MKIFILLFPLIFEALHDYYYIKDGTSPPKAVGVFIRIILSAYIALFMGGSEWALSINFFLVSVCFHIGIFAPLLNTLRGLPIYYLGNNWYDNLLKNFGKKTLIIWYIVMVAIGVGMYYFNTAYYA